jgi:4a-hydroxytetrahydrobiopterin dehydratase
MPDLLKMKCKQPVEGENPLTDAEIQEYLAMVQGWTVIENEGEKGIGKRYAFDDFAGPLEFAVRVGRLAEEEKHHPAIFFAWGRALLSWRTHKVKGLSLNDFIMAAKTDEIFDQLRK